MENEIKRSDLVSVREGKLGDKPFILATWLKGLRYGNDWFRLVDKTIYFGTYKRIIDAILGTPGTSVKVACLKEDPDVILGYAICNKDKVHWVHVKKAWRNIGIAKSIVPQDFKVVSHLTAVGASILRQKLPTVIFNPFLM